MFLINGMNWMFERDWKIYTQENTLQVGKTHGKQPRNRIIGRTGNPTLNYSTQSLMAKVYN